MYARHNNGEGLKIPIQKSDHDDVASLHFVLVWVTLVVRVKSTALLFTMQLSWIKM